MRSDKQQAESSGTNTSKVDHQHRHESHPQLTDETLNTIEDSYMMQLEDQPTVDLSTMALIRRIARYEARVWEGLHRTNGDFEEAERYAQQSPDGLPKDEKMAAIRQIETAENGRRILDAAVDAACREITLRIEGPDYEGP